VRSSKHAAVRITRNQAVSSAKVELAKRLRRTMTFEERTLWQAIRNNALSGLHFRRQQVIVGFIVDFYCASARLAIEVDGPVHSGRKDYDTERDLALSELGIRILRLSNASIRENLPMALDRVAKEAEHALLRAEELESRDK
jgi:very-short-patch-repair endonuclease